MLYLLVEPPASHLLREEERMIFAGSRIWYEGSATDLSAMTEEIRRADFSGHIVLEFQDSLDLVIVSRGEFVKVVEKIGRRILTAKKYREIWGKCQIKPGRMLIFTLPASLAEHLRGVDHRKPLCSGPSAGCHVAEILREQKAASLTGFIDGTCSEGKGLLELQDGVITSCYFTEYQGLAYRGIDAFRIWHGYLARTEKPLVLSLSEYRPERDLSHLWDRFLTEGIDEVKLPLPGAEERLFHAFGRTFPEAHLLFTEGEPASKAFYLLEGHVELSQTCGGKRVVLGAPGPGRILGLSWLNGKTAPSVSGTTSPGCRLLAFDRAELEQILYNSPSLSSLFIGQAASQLQSMRKRIEMYRSDPGLQDLESCVFQVLNRDPSRLREGLPPGDLFLELARIAPFSLPDMDRMIRDLVNTGRIELSGGRILPRPEEI